MWFLSNHKRNPTLLLSIPLGLKRCSLLFFLTLCNCSLVKPPGQPLSQNQLFSDFLNAFVICDRQNINLLFGVLDYKYSICSCDLDDKNHSGGIGENQLLYHIGLSQIHLFSFSQWYPKKSLQWFLFIFWK